MWAWLSLAQRTMAVDSRAQSRTLQRLDVHGSDAISSVLSKTAFIHRCLRLY